MSFSNEYFGEIRDLLDRLAENPPDGLDALSESILEAWDNGGKVVSFGNGGSASDSLHFTTELVARFDDDPIHKPAVSFCANPSTLTATANDWSFDEIFSRQVRAQVTSDDVVLGISTSGNSRNVIKGLEAAAELSARTFGLTGAGECKLSHIDARRIVVPSRKTSHIQEAHIACLHYVCDVIDRTLNK